MSKKIQATYQNKAFSLVEVLVSITILLLVAVTPMTIVTRANNSTAFANEQLIAFFLAQEGLEIVEKGRNDLYLRHFRYGDSFPMPMRRFRINNANNLFRHCINNECGIQIAGNGTIAQSISCNNSNNNCRLYFEEGGERAKYVHGGAFAGVGQELTKFTRKIRMEPSLTGEGKLQEMKVTSTVTWRTGSLIAGQQVQLVTYLTNIYDTD